MNAQVILTDENIFITIPISALKFAAAVAFNNECGFENHKYFIEDEKEFAKSLYYELTREEENGDTLVDLMLDKATINALEQGAEGIGGIE
jgi:hypothetical protein